MTEVAGRAANPGQGQAVVVISRAADGTTDDRHPLIAATRNADKVMLLTRVAGRRHELRPLPASVEAFEPETSGITGADPLVRIARAKAVSVSVALGGARTVASDGGLLVPGLGDRWHPARTRRFAAPAATNRDRAGALLDLTRDLTGEHRQIGWREAVAIAEGGRVVLTVTAEATPGWLIEEPLSDWEDDGQGFWVPRLWRDDGGPASSTGKDPGTDHWDRLALLVAPFLDGLASRRDP